jgi:hypothetical protein
MEHDEKQDAPWDLETVPVHDFILGLQQKYDLGISEAKLQVRDLCLVRASNADKENPPIQEYIFILQTEQLFDFAGEMVASCIFPRTPNAAD